MTEQTRYQKQVVRLLISLRGVPVPQRVATPAIRQQPRYVAIDIRLLYVPVPTARQQSAAAMLDVIGQIVRQRHDTLLVTLAGDYQRFA